MKTLDTDKAMAALARASCVNNAVTLKAGGAALSPEKRDEMLARCAAGQHVELELECMAFEQKPGEQNRNFVRFRDGAMLALGRSGAGRPFLRDHNQDDALARGGTILASQTEKRGEGDYAIRQTVKLTAPWAVELALRGLLDTLSIGWQPTGPVLCSVCSTNFYRCSHMPGERYSMRQMDDGSSRPMLDAAGPMVCERVYTSAELVETSAVSVPAVPSAHIEAIRAALSAQPGGRAPSHEDHMNPKLFALLGLAATAGANEDNVIAAIEGLQKDLAVERVQLQLAKSELNAAQAELVGFRAAQQKQAQDKFITDALALGKISSGDESGWRSFFETAPDKASAEMAKRAAGTATPVGLPRASGVTPPDPQVNTIDAQIAAAGGNPAKIRADLKRDGLSEASIEKQLAAMVSGKVA